MKCDWNRRGITTVESPPAYEPQRTRSGDPSRKGNHTLLVVNEPEWMKGLRPESLLNARDVAALFGFKSKYYLNHAISARSFPGPDAIIPGAKSSKQWRVSTIRAEIKRRKERVQGEEQK